MRRAMLASAALLGALLARPAGAESAAAPARTTPALSGPEMKAHAADYLSQMRQGLKAVEGKFNEARSSKDVIKLNCISEKLKNIKGLLRIGEQSEVLLQEALAKKEQQASEHEHMKLAIARQKVDQLKAEVEGCVGMLAFETGPTDVSVIEPGNLPNSDPTIARMPEPFATRFPPASAVR